MANLRDTILTSMKQYPGMFNNKSAVLFHIFLIIGGGTIWVNGEPIMYDEHNGDIPDRRVATPISMHDVRSNQVLDAVEMYPDLIMKESVCFDKYDVNSVFSTQDMVELARIPDDITDEWLKAALLVVSALIDKINSIRRNKYRDEEWIDKWSKWIDSCQTRLYDIQEIRYPGSKKRRIQMTELILAALKRN